jgi:hypothetical protein
MRTMSRVSLIGVAAIAVTVGIAQVGRAQQSPAGGPPGDRPGKALRVRADTTRPPVRQQPSLRVGAFQAERVAGGSGLGAAGDLLITFRGQGFVLTAKAPRVLVAEGVTLEASEINRDGTELYVLVPRAQIAKIAALRFDSVVVANPGARQDKEFGRVAVRATAAQLLRLDPAAPAVRLVYRDGAFSRETAPR